ncbi:hypothetical protein Nepgr_013274 [Nepenthes gracilis]|uniref:Disease resistance protein At4g27190-like leucine-rich repeats domain-containing protein n=1 Tax=Nepenthes gracilis TaxID=150966 RepID=A0AAD3SHJ9_NEPGR|nr:hypothetical protein Nepgr_013274 [Nepenthes gracilis]
MEYIASTNESNEEGIFPKLEELVVVRMRTLKGIYHGPDLYDDFSHLKNLYLQNIDYIQSFWDDNEDNVQDDKLFFNKKMKFPSLENLTIENVSGIVELWHLADVEEVVPAFPKLVKLKLYDLSELRSIWRSNDVITHRSFQNLKSLFVGLCPNLEMICPLSVAAALEQLELLSFHNNKNMKEIIAKEIGEMKNNDTEMAIFSKLQTMCLSYLPNLKCFFGGSIKLIFSSLKEIVCTNLEEMVAFVIPEYPEKSNALFNDKVVMPTIKHIQIFNAQGLQEIWGSHLDIGSFNKLENFSIAFAKKAMKVFSLDAIKQMQNLKVLRLHNFQLAEEFIDPVGFYNDEAENLALLPQLKNLVMHSFPRLKRVPWEELALKNLRELKLSKIHGLTSLFPVFVCRRLLNLETLHIIDCEKIEEIIGGKSSDTNIVEVEVVFPQLNFLKLGNLPAFRSLCSSNVILEFSFIKGVDFGQLQNQILSDLLKNFQHVKELQLERCEELFNRERRANAIPPRLRKFTLYNMPNLQRIPWMAFSVKSIHYLKIFKVHGLKFLFPASMYSDGFVQLEEIHIDGCRDLKQVFAQESIEDTSNNATLTTIILPRVKIIKLKKLPNLCSFSSENCHALKFPSLEEVQILECPTMKTFSYGSLSTPRPCKIRMDLKEEEECYDLNAFITKRKEAEETESTEGETSGEERETSREGAKEESIEGETSREDAKGEFVEGETSREVKKLQKYKISNRIAKIRLYWSFNYVEVLGTS